MLNKSIQDYHSNTRNQLLALTQPLKTATYSPVPHGEIISNLLEGLDKKGLVVASENYRIAKSGEQVIGCFNVYGGGDADMQQRIMFKNSYDRSMAVGFAVGTNIVCCSNGMVRGDVMFKKSHRGTVLQEIRAKIQEALDHLDEHFTKLITQKERMKLIEIDKKVIAELTGRLFIEEGIINAEQTSIIKRELDFSEHFQFDGTLWNYYNNITQSLKTSAPTNFIKSHADVHSFIEREYQLV
jgi:hypothetical protein